jgi:hypothetical protein
MLLNVSGKCNFNPMEASITVLLHDMQGPGWSEARTGRRGKEVAHPTAGCMLYSRKHTRQRLDDTARRHRTGRPRREGVREGGGGGRGGGSWWGEGGGHMQVPGWREARMGRHGEEVVHPTAERTRYSCKHTRRRLKKRGENGSARRGGEGGKGWVYMLRRLRHIRPDFMASRLMALIER